ncbi:hypothetical protein FJZ53_05365 [Candidatus Woesearchaeota archaeon]|nr:hypothetical protein [Candidatus Woesearchaeota archaeon]
MENEGLDQHFMVDRGLIKRITGYSELKATDSVLEIGPGKGFLTKELLKHSKVIAVEKDENFKAELEKMQRISKNLEIVFGNALKLIKTLKFNKLVANIPYNISEPLMRQLFRTQPELVVMTVSKSFADKLADEKSKIGLQTRLFFTIETKEEVPTKAFLPRPKTDSAVIRLIPREEETLTTTEIILREFTLLNDKKAKNALMEAMIKGLDITKKQSKALIIKLSLEKDLLEKNSDLLSSEEFLKLKDRISYFTD